MQCRGRESILRLSRTRAPEGDAHVSTRAIVPPSCVAAVRLRALRAPGCPRRRAVRPVYVGLNELCRAVGPLMELSCLAISISSPHDLDLTIRRSDVSVEAQAGADDAWRCFGRGGGDHAAAVPPTQGDAGLLAVLDDRCPARLVLLDAGQPDDAEHDHRVAARDVYAAQSRCGADFTRRAPGRCPSLAVTRLHARATQVSACADA